MKDMADATVLVVDDQAYNILLLEELLGHEPFKDVVTTTDPYRAIELFESTHPDIVLLDLHMPRLDGYGVMKQIVGRIPSGTYLPILVLTADITREAKQRALSLGAKDFLTKPFDPGEVLLRIKNLLETRFLHLELLDQNRILEERVAERTKDLEQAHLEILERLALAAEYRDDDTGEHTQRVGRTSCFIAQELGLPDEELELIRQAAPLHDVGKIGIPDQILLKPGRLTLAEYEIMKSHTKIGARILSGGRFPLLQIAEEIAMTHHERWDGGGYSQLKAEAIPIHGRIAAVADVFDALTHERPYKHAWPEDEAVDEIRHQSGAQFDPDVVRAFLTVHSRNELLSPREEELSLTDGR
ncbi:MAG: HD domain-containing phosphohydrolase [Actinomycetota bacterium]